MTFYKIQQVNLQYTLYSCSIHSPSTSLFISLSLTTKNESDPQIDVIYKNTTTADTTPLTNLIHSILSTFLFEDYRMTCLNFQIFGIIEGNDLFSSLFNGLSVVLLKSGIKTNDLMCSAVYDNIFVVYSLNRNSVAYMKWNGEILFNMEKMYEAINECCNVADEIKQYIIDSNEVSV